MEPAFLQGINRQEVRSSCVSNRISFFQYTTVLTTPIVFMTMLPKTQFLPGFTLIFCINSYCDGQFYVPSWLGCCIHLFKEILIQALLQRYFIDVVNTYNQLTLSKEKNLSNIVSNPLKVLGAKTAKTEVFQEKKILS